MTSNIKVDQVSSSNGTSAFNIDASGRMLKGTSGSLVAFHAYPTSNYTTAYGTYNVDTQAALKYQSTLCNYGNHYSTTTGRFVAPVTGLYRFSNVMSINATTAVWNYMSAEIHYWAGNTSTLTQRYIGGWGNKVDATNAYGREFYSIALPLTAGDGVSGGYEAATGALTVLSGSSQSAFSGHLIG